MKFHKIRNVPREVCTAEQKIAYNLSWTYIDALRGKSFNSVPDIARYLLTFYSGKYDRDAIFCALNAGVMDYIKNPFIALTYQQIGNTFSIPAEYLER